MDDQTACFSGLAYNFLNLIDRPHASHDDHVHPVVRELSQDRLDQLVTAGPLAA